SAIIQRFIEEAQTGGQLQHPGILPVDELGLNSSVRPYFVMRLVKDWTLAETLPRRPPPLHAPVPVLAIFGQGCQTVAYAHTRGVVHRDLKLLNVMVGAFGDVRVVDWGLSKVLRQGGEGERNQGPSSEDDEAYVSTVRSIRGGAPSQSG